MPAERKALRRHGLFVDKLRSSNAAIGVLRPAMELKLKHWRRCMETNALALNTLAQQAVPFGHGLLATANDFFRTDVLPLGFFACVVVIGGSFTVQTDGRTC